MRRTQSQRLYTYFAIFIAALMALSVIFPLFSLNNPVVQDVEPTDAPTATQPAPPTDLSAIGFENTYLHPSGLFTVAQPTGWEPGAPGNTGVEASIRMNNPQYLTDVESFVIAPSSPVTTAEEVSNYFADISATVRGYVSPRETGRRVENGQSLIDFEVTQSQQPYIGRQVAWTDGQWIYGVRVVAPTNLRDLLLYLLENEPQTLEVNELFTSSPLGWTSFYNPQAGEIIRYPSNWTIVDGGVGSTVTINGFSGEVLRLEVPSEGQVADEAAAQAQVESLRPGATIASVIPVERNGGSGYAVAYNEQSLDGVGESGLAVLLNGDDGLLHIANIRIPVANVDLNAPAADAGFAATDAANIMGSYNLTEGLGLPIPTPTPSPTATLVPPTPVPATEAAPASTEDAAVTNEASITEEVIATDDVGPTDEATPEATEEAS
jgi:hypothetical protein